MLQLNQISNKTLLNMTPTLENTNRTINCALLLLALTAHHSIAFPAFGPRDEVTSIAPPPDRNVSLGSCTWIIDHKCPDEDNIKVYLFTRRNMNDRQLIFVSDTWEKSNLSTSHFDPSDPVKIIIHGYNSDMYLSPLIDMKDEYLQRGSYNLFYIDWSSLAPGPCYISAVHNARHSGICIGQLVKRILESGTDDIHLIGFSLGAHVTNFVANSVKPFVIPRITGLDPAMPLFMTASKENKLDESDARFVDVIHTNALLQGKIERCGHADFYMNGGIVQPGCSRGNPFACSHHRAPDYFAESIRSYRGFWGWACSSYINYLLGLCPRTNFLVVAGEDCTATTKGMFLVTTNSISPFANGRWTEGQMGSALLDEEPDIHRPFKNSEPQVQHLDEWGKLEGSFNNLFNPNEMAASMNVLGDHQWDEVFNELDVEATKRPQVVRKPLKKKTQFEIAYADEIIARQPEADAVDKQHFAELYNTFFGRGTTIRPEVITIKQ